LKIKKRFLNQFQVHNLLFNYLTMNSLFVLRKVNKIIKTYSDSFLEFYADELDLKLKQFYEFQL
jgi:hypothetical protein